MSEKGPSMSPVNNEDVFDLRSVAFKNLKSLAFKNQIIVFNEAKSIPGLYDFAVKHRTHQYDRNVVDNATKLVQASSVAAKAQEKGIGKDVDFQKLRFYIKVINAVLLYKEGLADKDNTNKKDSFKDIVDDITSKF